MMTVTQFRKDLYRILDRALQTGDPVQVTRKGELFLVVPSKKKSRLDGLKKRNVIKCDPEELVHVDWSKHYRRAVWE